MRIPRYYDEKSETAYELYWFCTECGWALAINSYRIGREECFLCGSPTKRLRTDYPQWSKDITKVLT